MKRTIPIILLVITIFFISGLLIIWQKNISLKEEVFILQTRETQRNAIWNSAKTKSEILNILVSEIILAEKEIPLKVRVNLENKIDASGDKILRTKWDTFAESKDKEVGQKAIEDLLKYLTEEVYKSLR